MARSTSVVGAIVRGVLLLALLQGGALGQPSGANSGVISTTGFDQIAWPGNPGDVLNFPLNVDGLVSASKNAGNFYRLNQGASGANIWPGAFPDNMALLRVDNLAPNPNAGPLSLTFTQGISQLVTKVQVRMEDQQRTGHRCRCLMLLF